MSTAPMKPLPKLVLIGGTCVALFLGARFAMSHGWIPTPGVMQSVVPTKVTLPNVEDAQIADVAPAAYPTSTVLNCADPVRAEVWAWNSQMGWLYSNGGIDTTRGSLAEKYGVCQHFTRQDDTSQMATDLVACASELKNGTECQSGVQLISIMADGSGAFFATTNAQLKKICDDCTAEIVGTVGFSRGEDKLMGPEGWKRNPHAALGDGLIAGVLRDGDWNTAQKWAADNNLKNNPDEHTFDAGALNWVNASSYTDAAEKYVAGYCEDRKVAKDGKLTGETKHVCVKGIVTWTPGDVTAAENKGGIVTIVSTKQYRSQMPMAMIGIRKWDKSHGDKIAGILAAALQGGDQVKAFPEALKRASDISAKVYGEKNGAYWMKYYKGVTQTDAQGIQVDLGGSYADNMNDALTAFGLAAGANNNVKATYTIFAKIVDQQYHDLFKSTPIPPYEKVSNTAYLLQAKGLIDNGGSQADTVQYGGGTGEKVGDKNWAIEFATGSSTLTPRGMDAVQEIKDQVAITGLNVELDGHTDNTGNATANRGLSEQRAESVKRALQHLAPSTFPEERFKVQGFGSDKPIASNATADGREKNRRVEVILAE